MTYTSVSLIKLRLLVTACIAASSFILVSAQDSETHTVSFTNNCGKGTPVLGGPNGEFYQTDNPVQFTGPAPGLISYLQYTDDDGNDVCGLNGEGCTLIEADLTDQGSNADITVDPPHAFSVTSGFGFYGGCDGAGADCTSADCSNGNLLVSCGAPNVNLAITFCD